MAKYVGVSDQEGARIEGLFKPQAANIPQQPNQPLNIVSVGDFPKGFVPDVNQAITRATSKPTDATILQKNQTQYAPPPPAPINGVASEVATTVEKVNAAQEVKDQPKDQRAQIQEYLGNVFKSQQDLPELSQQMRDDAQLKQKEEKSRKLSEEMTARERAYTKQVKEIEKNKQGKFGGAIADELENARKEYNSEQADLAIQYNVALGDFQAAEKVVEKKISDIEKSYTNQIDTLKTAYTFLQNDLTDSEKMKAQQEFDLLRDEKDFEQQKAYASYQQTIRENDPMYQLQLDTERLQQANIQSQIDERNKLPATETINPKTGKEYTADELKTIESRSALVDLLNQYKALVSSTNVLTRSFPGETKGKLESLKTQIAATYKDYKKLGTYDTGVERLIDGLLGNKGIGKISTATQVAALENAIANLTTEQEGGVDSDPLGLFN